MRMPEPSHCGLDPESTSEYEDYLRDERLLEKTLDQLKERLWATWEATGVEFDTTTCQMSAEGRVLDVQWRKSGHADSRGYIGASDEALEQAAAALSRFQPGDRAVLNFAGHLFVKTLDEAHVVRTLCELDIPIQDITLGPSEAPIWSLTKTLDGPGWLVNAKLGGSMQFWTPEHEPVA